MIDIDSPVSDSVADELSQVKEVLRVRVIQ